MIDIGYLNARVLDSLRSSEIELIALSESLSEANGLNLSAHDILPGEPHHTVLSSLLSDDKPAFSKPNSFAFLSELSFTGATISDFDLTHIQHLPKLSTLLLNNTGISNEAYAAHIATYFLRF
jgi:hypothetical protein